eukprot:TRINITY_DN59916_c0_g1_i1.p1 TRINITY_DN59916_c0_g1~~TRINITY_DN59916_c0_g1_i1.p1  ORF type:complete len:528 (-),score=226.73 TRINITY_DN59916_c0_g1_i1:50-1633(-)
MRRSLAQLGRRVASRRYSMASSCSSSSTWTPQQQKQKQPPPQQQKRKQKQPPPQQQKQEKNRSCSSCTSQCQCQSLSASPSTSSERQRVKARLDRVLNQYSTRRVFVQLSAGHDPVVDRGQFGRGAKLEISGGVDGSSRDRGADEPERKSAAVTTLGQLLRRMLPEIRPNEWAERMDWGGLFVNGMPQTTLASLDNELPYPCRVEYYMPNVWPREEAERAYPLFTKDNIIYRDQHLIAVYKPARLSTMPPKEQRYYSVRSCLLRLLDEDCTNRSGSVLHVPSRLDWATSGVVLMSIHPSTHASLQRLFQKRSIRKTYIFEAAGESEELRDIGDTVEVDRAIGKHPVHPVLFRVQPRVYDDCVEAATTAAQKQQSPSNDHNNSNNESKDGKRHADGDELQSAKRRRLRGGKFSKKQWKPAHTTMELLGRSSFVDEHGATQPSVIVKATPHTGRTHQIRLHAQSIGLSILNDPFYDGPRTLANARSSLTSDEHDELHLLAFELAFDHPVTHERVVITVPERHRPAWLVL